MYESITNYDRANTAESAIIEFMRATNTDREDAISDLLGNLMHLCDRDKVDFLACLNRGRYHYDAEIEVAETDSDDPALEPSNPHHFVMREGAREVVDTEKRFSSLELEAALCVWEEINERTVQDVTKRHAGLVAWREAYGSAQCRNDCQVIGKFCLDVYDAGGADIHGVSVWDAWSYDWEVIPTILMTIDFDEHGFTLPSDISGTAATVLTRLKG